MLEPILNFFISSAQADTGAAPAAGGLSSNLPFLVMMAAFIFFMYFAVWRPQRKRDKEQKELLGALSKGDEVLTVGGIIGKISKISDIYAVLAIADNVEITILKSSIANPLPKGTLKSI